MTCRLQEGAVSPWRTTARVSLYLGFILYDLYFKNHPHSHLYGIETRAELVEKSKALATKLHFERMSFLNVSVAELPPAGKSFRPAPTSSPLYSMLAIPRRTMPLRSGWRKGEGVPARALLPGRVLPDT